MSRMIDRIMNAEHVSKYSLLFNGTLTVDHAEIAFKNFGARGTKANPVGGKRTFCLLLSEEMAARLNEDNWNVKVKEIRDQYQEGEETMTVTLNQYNEQYRGVFDNAMLYTEIVVNENGNPPAVIYKASEYNGEKVCAPVPVERWADLDKSMLSDITVVIHPWKHGRNIQNPDAKKGYLNSMVTHVQTAIGVGLGETYSDYRVVGE